MVGLGNSQSRRAQFSKKDRGFEWTFGQTPLVEGVDAAKLDPKTSIKLWYTVDGRKKDGTYTGKDITVSHEAAWAIKMLEENKHPVCINDDWFDSEDAWPVEGGTTLKKLAKTRSGRAASIAREAESSSTANRSNTNTPPRSVKV